jgi:peptidoglycan/xylan/chitin deacetylase (PgdA/CDA1 family)
MRMRAPDAPPSSGPSSSPAAALARWLPSPLLKGSLALHLAAGAAVAVQPLTWPLALGAFVADHLILSTVGLVPRGSLLGPNLTRLPAAAGSAIALTIDDGPDPEVTPRVLELLAARRVRATFFCVGGQLRAHPALARELVAQGHSIENHTQNHPYHFSFFGPRAMTGEIAAAQDTIGGLAGRAPRFFRAPAGLRNPFLQPVLGSLGLRLASWTRRGFDTVERDPVRVQGRLLRGLAARDILLLHDHRAARTAAGTPVILEVLPRLLDAVAAAGLATVTLDEAVPEGAPC